MTTLVAFVRTLKVISDGLGPKPAAPSIREWLVALAEGLRL